MTEVGHRLSNCELILLIMNIRKRPTGGWGRNRDRMMLLTAQDNNNTNNTNTNTNVKFNISWYEKDFRADGLRDHKGTFEDIDGFYYNTNNTSHPLQAMKDEQVVLEFMPDTKSIVTLKNLTDKDKLIALYESVMSDAEPAKCHRQIEGGRSSRKTRKAKKTHNSRKAKKTHKSRKPRKAKKTHRRRKSRRVNKTHKRK